MRYFRVLTDPESSDRWFLDEPVAANGTPIDAREFTASKAYSGPDPQFVPIQRAGKQEQFNLAAFDMPVVSEKLAVELKRIAVDEVVFYPVLVGSTVCGFEIMNVLPAAKCLDESKSQILFWKPEDGRPDKVGHYRMVTRIKVDPILAEQRHIFRIKGWEIALIVSEVVRDRLCKLGRLGVVFEPV
jgi:hypothetical protein